ncbi:MAG: class I SAM-dependent methyltransferase family protein [Candidatus Aenigmatarchaeota archaeon]|nr:MAG: class I SAM-dependent methyltransferase family protein [Candidatus Aenigmarchaeota archaeon]
MIIGDILVLRKNPGRKRAQRMLKGKIKTVCFLKQISGKKRKPEIEVLAGDGLKTIHREAGCLFELDLSKFMWSPGNRRERERMQGLVKPGETVIDMFAGIGYWSIPIAKACPECRIIAIDINPEAIRQLERNCQLNGISNISARVGDCRELAKDLQDRADRIILGWIFRPESFLDAAFRMLKPKGIIHFHYLDRFLQEEELKRAAERAGYSFRILSDVKVKQYSPRTYHRVMDLEAWK